jgi:protein gp37
MASTTQIEWTDATWNPVTGCTKITRGCDFCYAERFSERFRGVPGHPFENGFDLKLRPERLSQPLSWRQTRRIFVNSMSDLFHKEIPRSFIDSIFDTMEAADWHTFQILTKRSSLTLNILREIGQVSFSELWEILLQAYMLRVTNVKDLCVELAKIGKIEQTWGGGTRKPSDQDAIKLKLSI